MSRPKPKAVLVFGESENDSRAIKELVEGLKPALDGKVQVRRRPLVLVKNVQPDELVKRKDKLARQVRADQVTYDVRAVLIHEDCDDVEPAHERIEAARYREGAFASVGVPVVPVLPAWDIEAWWLLWPEALGAYQPSWRAPTEFRGKRVGALKNTKERLRAAVRPRGRGKAAAKRFRDYKESDSPGIARCVRERRELDKPGGRSDSYARFRALVDGIAV